MVPFVRINVLTQNYMRDFAAIDFETANFERSSVCSVGIVIVRDEKSLTVSTPLSSRSRTITPTVARKFMDYAARTPSTHRFFPKCGNR